MARGHRNKAGSSSAQATMHDQPEERRLDTETTHSGVANKRKKPTTKDETKGKNEEVGHEIG